jgi:glycosyltransferase involved in cell wall biosynthesis
MSDIRVLVLMVTRNGQSHLAEQLDSILGQEGVDVTVRVSDDCSSDNTFRILETYAAEHPSIELLFNAGHQGITRSYMDLIYNAPADEYDYFALAGQDDIWYPEKLTAAAAHISANTSRAELYYAGVHDMHSREGCQDNPLEAYTVCAEHTGSLLLVKNWCLGCTTLMNGALIKLLCRHKVYDFGRSYDTWIHAVALYCGGYVHGDLHHVYVDCRSIGHEADDSPDLITQMAQVLIRDFRYDMDPDSARLVEAVGARHVLAKARRFLFSRKDIVMPTEAQTARLRYAVLFNKI